jgi:hypothetical protein
MFKQALTVRAHPQPRRARGSAFAFRSGPARVRS